MDTLSDMTLFVRVAEAGSVSAAARSLGVPRSTISRRITALEKRLEVTLLQRTTRKLRLTEAGRIFQRRCTAILADVAAMESEVSALDDAIAGVLRVGAPSGIGTEWFQTQIGEFFEIYPDIRLELILDHRARDLLDEDLDLAVIRGPLEDSSLLARKIAPGDLLCVATPRYLESSPPLESPVDLENHRCLVALHEAFDGAQWPLLHGDTVGVVPRFSTTDMHYLREALLAHTGVALVPWISVIEELESGELAPVLVDTVGERDTPYYAVYAPESRHVSKVSATVEFLVMFFARHVGRHTPPWEAAP